MMRSRNLDITARDREVTTAVLRALGDHLRDGVLNGLRAVVEFLSEGRCDTGEGQVDDPGDEIDQDERPEQDRDPSEPKPEQDDRNDDDHQEVPERDADDRLQNPQDAGDRLKAFTRLLERGPGGGQFGLRVEASGRGARVSGGGGGPPLVGSPSWISRFSDVVAV
jgi:hypothetical protein